jgi:hypothetical protein
MLVVDTGAVVLEDGAVVVGPTSVVVVVVAGGTELGGGVGPGRVGGTASPG